MMKPQTVGRSGVVKRRECYIELIGKDRSVTPCFNTFYEFVRDDYRRQLEQKNVREKGFLTLTIS